MFSFSLIFFLKCWFTILSMNCKCKFAVNFFTLILPEQRPKSESQTTQVVMGKNHNLLIFKILPYMHPEWILYINKFQVNLNKYISLK